MKIERYSFGSIKISGKSYNNYNEYVEKSPEKVVIGAFHLTC